MAVLTYRLVKGSPLTKEEHDGNIHNLDDRITALEDSFQTAIQIQSIDLVGTDFVFTMDDYSTFTAAVPNIEWRPRGTWAASTPYLVRDIFTAEGVLYKVIFNHTSDLTFDPGANDGMGNDYYEVIAELVSEAVSSVLETTDAAISTLAILGGKYVRCNNSTGTEVTILSDETYTHEVGTEITFRLGVGGFALTFVKEDDDTIINYPDEQFDLLATAKGAVVQFKKIGTGTGKGEWDAFGMLDLANSA